MAEQQTLADLGKAMGMAATPAAAVVADAKPKLDKQGRAYATGRRKNAVARVWVKLSALDVARQRPFASVADLTTGRERPVELQRDDAAQTYSFEVKQCPARTMLRVYWPLAAR